MRLTGSSATSRLSISHEISSHDCDAGVSDSSAAANTSSHRCALAVRAMLAFSQGKQTLKLLAVTSGYELAVAEAFMNTPPFLYLLYLRGQAYLKARQQAAATFQKLLFHYQLGALARLHNSGEPCVL
jgi:hypothetical protein